MAVKPENTFRNGVHKYLPRTVHHEKMNNPYSSGTADDWYSGSNADLWVEYKFLPRVPQRGTVKIAKLFSPLQLRWLSGRYTEGRNIACIIGCPTGGVILRDKVWEEIETSVASFLSHIKSRTDLASWIREQVER